MLQKIHIIESPSEEDLAANRIESPALTESLKLFNLESTPYVVKSKDEFKDIIIDSIGDNILSLKPEVIAHFLHFSCHGNSEGIGLTNGDFLNWEELAEILKELNDKVGYVEIPNNPQSVFYITVSSCEGLNMFKVVDHVPQPPLFNALIGPNTPVSWPDALLAFTTFYHNSILHKKGIHAVENMNSSIYQNVFEAKMHPQFETFWNS